MKVALIHPNIRGEFYPSLGLTYIATILAQHHKVSIWDFTFHKKWWKKFLKIQMQKIKPEIIGITSLTYNFFDGLRIAKVIRREYPDIPIIFGGIHPTLMPKETLAYDEIDAICIGEGEITFLEYINNLERGISLKNVQGIWFKENGHIIKNEVRPLIEDLDVIPFPDWRFWNLDLYLKVPPHTNTIDVLASRGCPFDCSFCSNHILRQILPGKYLRFRSAKKIIEEIKILKENYWQKGFRIIYFWDENFLLDKKIFNQFCKLYREEGLNKEIIWTVNMRANLITNEWAETAKKAGCFQVRLGIESGSDFIRNEIYNKNVTTQEIRKTTEILKRNDIMMRFNMMLGGPCETEETMKSTVHLIDELEPEIFFFAIFQPLPKTRILETIKKYHGVVNEDLWKENPDFWRKALVDQPNLSQKYIEYFTNKTLLKYVWKFFWQGLKMRRFTFLKDLLHFFTKIMPKYQVLPIYAAYHTIKSYQVNDWKIRNRFSLE